MKTYLNFKELINYLKLIKTYWKLIKKLTETYQKVIKTYWKLI